MEDQLVQGSIRSLPHGQMQNIRRMFEKSCDQENTISDQLGETETDNTYTEQVEMDQDEASSRLRQHISPPPPHVSRDSRSPVRTTRNVSPSTTAGGSYHPKPTPRKHIDHGISGLPVKQFGQIATSVALNPTQGDTPYRVSKVRDQFEQNPYRKSSEGNIKVPLKPKNKSPSPARKFGNSPNRVPERKSPVAIRKHCQDHSSREEHVYSKIWEKNSGKSDEDVPKTDETHRPVSVFERSKMFEGVGSSNNDASIPQGISPSKPLKPPPPSRQRSFSGGNSDNVKLNSQGKPLPPRPPVSQRSFVDKSKETDSVKETVEKQSGVQKPVSKPPAPAKPKRTGAHDDYMKVKLENQMSNGRVKIQETQKENCDDAPVTQTKNTKVDFSQRELPEIPEPSNKKKKPTRPPPPRSKTRPFSIATDSLGFRSSEGSDSDELSDHNKDKNDNPFYEVIPAHAFLNKNKNEQLKHWDLPRASHPEPIRRSLSAECIQKAVDDKGNVVYMDPDQLRINSGGKGYDIYVDTEGYAVPNRLIRRNKSIDDTNEPNRAIGDRVKSKFRRFKNLFTEQDKPSTEKSSAPDRGSQKRKLDAIRNKINQAFEVLQSSIRQTNNNNISTEDNDDELAERLSNDSDSKVDEKEIRKRVEYSRSIRIKTSKSIRETRKYEKKIYPQLFEHAMIVSLQHNPDTAVYEPYVVYKFPEIRNYKLTMEGKLFPCSEAKDTNVSVPLFCFPDAANFKPSSSSSKSQSYNFVLTNIDGGRVYGYCRRLVPPKSPHKVPEVICIISPIDAFNMYNTLLEEIERTRLISLDAAQELIAASFGRPLPSPGQSETIRTLDKHGEMETIFVTRDTDNRIENVNCECLLTNLGPDKLLKVFSTILLERSVLFCAKHLSTLSSTIHAIVSLLYPFSWQHTFIPVLPSDMIDVVCSPTPYIIGITTSLVPKLTDLPIEENVLIVDIDKKSFICCQGDEGTLLPKKIEKALKTSLNMCRFDSDVKNCPDLMISEAFVRFFVEAIGHYGEFIITQQDSKKVFRKENFVKGTSSNSLQQLLEWFVETQMFEVFITKQIEKTDWGNTIEYFESRVQENMFTRGQKRRLGKIPSAVVFSPE